MAVNSGKHEVSSTISQYQTTKGHSLDVLKRIFSKGDQEAMDRSQLIPPHWFPRKLKQP